MLTAEQLKSRMSEQLDAIEETAGIMRREIERLQAENEKLSAIRQMARDFVQLTGVLPARNSRVMSARDALAAALEAPKEGKPR